MKEPKTHGVAPAARLPRIAQDAIGRRLRQSFDQIIAEPVPDRFLSLLDSLAETQTDAPLDPDGAAGRDAAAIPAAAPAREISAGQE